MAVIAGCATAPAAPYEQKIASWPTDLPEDEYVAFSDDENLVTHIELQFSGRGANLNSSMARFEERVREAVLLSGHRDDQSKDVGVGLVREPRIANPCTDRSGGRESAEWDFCDKDLITRAIEAHGEDLRFCYEAELQTFETLAGWIIVQFKIMPDGQVRHAALRASTKDHPPAEQCVLNVIRRIDFPKPDGGACSSNYPFSFARAKGRRICSDFESR